LPFVRRRLCVTSPVVAPWSSPLLERASGAVAVDPESRPFDAGVADHYGDPLREQRLLAQGRGVVDLGHRGVVSVTGADRLSWLHSLLSQHVELLDPGVGTQALLLSPNGHVEQHVHLVDDGTTTWIHTEPGMQGELIRFLDSMRFMLRVEVVDVTNAFAVVWFPDAGRGRAASESAAGSIVVPTTRGVHVLLPRDTYDDVVLSVGDPAGVWAHEALRVEAHEPRLRLETDHRTIPHEVAWIGPAVHLQKGCYRGQETVARVHNLGRPPRRLVMLHLDGSTNELPVHGDEVLLDGRAIGFVGAAVHHYELGPIALAIVKRALDPEATLTVAGVSAAQEVIVAP
jgi:tRNA-modifying protein YgfZ